MPQCGCFHKFDLVPIGSTDFKLTINIEGKFELKNILEKAGMAQSVSESLSWFGHTYSLAGVGDEARLRAFLDSLRSCIIIDLAPLVDECYALGPYSVADEEDGPISGPGPIGDLVQRAKYRGDRDAIDQLRRRMTSFVSRHPRYSNAGFVVAVPPSTPASANLPSQFVQAFDRKTVAQANKTRLTPPQKELLAAKDESALRANISNSIRVTTSLAGAAVIVVDDICGSGETLKEVSRACRAAGAKEVLGLIAAKDAIMLQGGVSLVREQWE